MNKKYKTQLPKYYYGGNMPLDNTGLKDENKSALSYGIDYGMQGLSAGLGAASSFGDIAGVTGSAIFGGVGLVGGLLDGIINGKKDAEYANRQNRKNQIDLMQANMYTGATNPSQSMGPTVTYPYGGKVFNPNAEVEGGEVLQTPNNQPMNIEGQMVQPGYDQPITVNGPSHANGGVQVEAPRGTRVFSDRLKHKLYGNSETYAKTADRLNGQIARYKDKSSGYSDKMSRDAASLMIARTNNKLDELFADQESKKAATMPEGQAPEMKNRKALAMRFKHGDLHKHAYGDLIGWPPYDPIFKPEQTSSLLNNNILYGAMAQKNTDRLGLSTTLSGLPSQNTNAEFTPSLQTVSGIDNNINMPKFWKSDSKGIGTGLLNTMRDNRNTSVKPMMNAGRNLLDPYKYNFKIYDEIKPLNFNFAKSNVDEQEKKSLMDLGYSEAEATPGTKEYADRIASEEKERKKKDRNAKSKGVGAGLLEAAPMIYNLLQNKPEQTALAPLLNTNFMTPKMQEDAQQLREAERTYGAIINDKNKSTAERLQAARMLQAAKGQIMENTINKYRQDEMIAKQFNAEITNRNIAMGYQVGVDNAADRASIKNAQSQAMKDLSQLAQKRNLEGNMADKNEYLKNAVKSIYPEFEIKDDGTVVYAKTKAKLSDEDQQKYNALMAILYAMNNTSTGSNGIGSGYYGSMMGYQSNNPAVSNMYQKKNAGG